MRCRFTSSTQIVLTWSADVNGGCNADPCDASNGRGRKLGLGVIDVAAGTAAQVATGNGHTCALTTGGGVMCWGDNPPANSGRDDERPVDPTAVSGLGSGVTTIAAGAIHTCALTTGGGVMCWGGNSYGQLGDGTTTDVVTPTAVSGLASGVAAIAAGDSPYLRSDDGRGRRVLGRQLSAQLGDGTTSDGRTPTPVSGLASGVAACGGP